MTEVAARIQPIPHALLQRFGIGKAAIGLAIPDRRLVIGDDKHPAGSGNKRHLVELGAEGRKQLLSQPSRAQKPSALRAVRNGNARSDLAHAGLTFALRAGASFISERLRGATSCANARRVFSLTPSRAQRLIGRTSSLVSSSARRSRRSSGMLPRAHPSRASTGFVHHSCCRRREGADGATRRFAELIKDPMD